MKLYSTSIIGDFHINHNEDYYISSEIGTDKILIAVLDGCSMGKESHFAATLIGKTLRQIAKEYSYKEFIMSGNVGNVGQRHAFALRTLPILLKNILRDLFKKLIIFKGSLGLEREELLSTLILGIVDSKEKKAEILTVGDGLVSYNGELMEYEQDDRPDYLGYHLTEDFETWFANQHQKLSLSNINDLSLSTDGIFTFKPFNNQKYPFITMEQIIDFLLKDKKELDSDNALDRKLRHIEKEYGLRPTDDLTIIRWS